MKNRKIKRINTLIIMIFKPKNRDELDSAINLYTNSKIEGKQLYGDING